MENYRNVVFLKVLMHSTASLSIDQRKMEMHMDAVINYVLRWDISVFDFFDFWG